MIGKRSPWGTIQECREIAPGILSVSTAGHGGIKLDRRRNAAMPAPYRRAGGWYEEDCEWCLVAITFPAELLGQGGDPTEALAEALAVVKNVFPDEYMAATGKALGPEESLVLRRRAFAAATKDRFVVTSAFGVGSWVPRGKVGVYARRAADGASRHFLVDESEYDAQGDSFVIDESRHCQVAVEDRVDDTSKLQRARQLFSIAKELVRNHGGRWGIPLDRQVALTTARNFLDDAIRTRAAGFQH